MMTMSFHSNCKDAEIQPKTEIKRDTDGDFWIKFFESGYTTEIDVIMTAEQFTAFAYQVHLAKDLEPQKEAVA